MNISQVLTKLKALIYSKSETDSLLGGKANSSHTHTKSQITDFPSLATVATSGSYSDLSNKPSSMTPSSHSHGNITNAGAIGTAANKPLITTTNGAITTGSFGTTANTFCQGNDSRLSDARTPTSHTHTKSQITDFPTIPTKTSQLTNDSGFLTSSGSCNYANSAGNSDTLDGYHEYSFLRYRGGTSTSGEGTLWAQIGIKDYNNALPDGLSGVYQWGEVVSLAGGNGRFDIYCSHNSSNGNGLYYRSGWANDKKDWKRFIDSANIGSQSVNYANSAGSAGSVAWTNVSGRPTKVSQFTNDSEFWSPGGGKWNPNANISLPASGNNQEWSFDMHRNGKTGCYWHVWEDSLGTCLRVDADNGAVSIPKNILYLGGYKVYVG